MNLFRYIIINCLAICAIPNLVLAQYTKSEIALASYEDKTIDAILLKPSNSVVRLNSKKLGIEQIKTGGYKGYSYRKFQNSVIFQGQQPIMLPVNERFIYRNVQENRLYTYKNNWKSQEVSFKLYDLKNHNLSLIKELIKLMPYSIVYNSKRNIILLTDYDERFGRTVDIYSKDKLDLISSFTPFNSVGFQDMMYFEDEQFLYALFKPSNSAGYNDNEIKLYKFSLKTGEILQAKELIIPLSINGFYVTNNCYILYSSRMVIAYSFEGIQLWSKSLTIKRGEIKADIPTDILYLGLSDRITAINLSDGKTIWEKAYSDFYLNELIDIPINLSNIKIRPVFFNIIEGNLVVIIGQTTSGGRHNPKYLTGLYIVNSIGKIVTHETIKSTETTLLKCFFKDLNNFTVINDNAIVSYEK